MIEGDMLTMDNDRLLHGRSAFQVNESDKRWLQQAYVDWDVLRSKTEVLKKKLLYDGSSFLIQTMMLATLWPSILDHSKILLHES